VLPSNRRTLRPSAVCTKSYLSAEPSKCDGRNATRVEHVCQKAKIGTDRSRSMDQRTRTSSILVVKVRRIQTTWPTTTRRTYQRCRETWSRFQQQIWERKGRCMHLGPMETMVGSRPWLPCMVHDTYYVCMCIGWHRRSLCVAQPFLLGRYHLLSTDRHCHFATVREAHAFHAGGSLLSRGLSTSRSS
jgi:hypothetical protein